MELRKHYFLDKWVIIAAGRSKRPKQFRGKEKSNVGTDFFAVGNEHLTPPEIGRVSLGDSWKFRWFPNKFPFVSCNGDAEVQTDNEFYTFSSAYGNHEVIVETNDIKKQFWDLSSQDLSQVFQIYSDRIMHNLENFHIKYVVVFKNHGQEAGTSILHSHTQLAAVNFIPFSVLNQCRDDSPYTQIIKRESNSDRRVFENSSFISFCPYASRFSYEVWVFPKRYVGLLSELSKEEFIDLGEIMHRLLKKLKEINASYNYYLHYAPQGKKLHFHIEITPRLSTWAGFELASDVIINTVSPEDAAAFYRE